MKLSAAGVQVLHLELNTGNRAAELYRRLGYAPHKIVFMSKWLQRAMRRVSIRTALFLCENYT